MVFKKKLLLFGFQLAFWKGSFCFNLENIGVYQWNSLLTKAPLYKSMFLLFVNSKHWKWVRNELQWHAGNVVTKYCVADLCHSDLWIYGHISTGEVRHPKEHCRRVLGFQLAHPLRHPWCIPRNYHLLWGTPPPVRRLHRPDGSSGCLLPRSGDRPSHVPQGQHSFVYATSTNLCNLPSM